MVISCDVWKMTVFNNDVTPYSKSKAVPLYVMEALGGRGGIAPTYS
jgi:hypothetical protein